MTFSRALWVLLKVFFCWILGWFIAQPLILIASVIAYVAVYGFSVPSLLAREAGARLVWREMTLAQKVDIVGTLHLEWLRLGLEPTDWLKEMWETINRSVDMEDSCSSSE